MQSQALCSACENAHYVEVISGVNVVNLYGRMNPSQREALVRFWVENGAVPDRDEAQRRTQEVVHLALSGDGRIVGVNTCYAAPLNEAAGAARYWFYRQYMHPQARNLRLSLALVRLTVAYFTEASRHGAGPKGIAMYLENPKLYKKSGRRVMHALNMTLAEKRTNGAEVWTRDFFT
jgi:hypothetical protein